MSVILNTVNNDRLGAHPRSNTRHRHLYRVWMVHVESDRFLSWWRVGTHYCNKNNQYYINIASHQKDFIMKFAGHIVTLFPVPHHLYRANTQNRRFTTRSHETSKPGDWDLGFCNCYKNLTGISAAGISSLMPYLHFTEATYGQSSIFACSAGPRGNPSSKASDAKLWCFLWSASE